MTGNDRLLELGHDDRTPSLRVVEAVADAEGVDPFDLEAPLYDAIDPTALDRLFEPTARGETERQGQVTFEFCGYDVTVRSDGSVSIE